LPTLLLSRAAREDLLAIYVYLAERDRTSADRFIDGVHRRCEQLGRPRDDVRAGARSILFRRWTIFYQPAADRILVLRVVDAARDVSRLNWPEDDAS